MTSVTRPQPETPDNEELVAYLDGELPPDACRRIEQRLAADPEYRRQLQELDQTWEALDELPQSTAHDEFTRTTLGMITVEAERDLSAQRDSQPALRRRRTLLFVLVCVVATTVGLAAAHVLAPNPDEALLADLPTVTQVDLLTQVGDVDYLRGLSQMPLGLFTENETELEQELAQLELADAPSRDDRRHWVEQLPADQRAELAGQWKRFQSLSPAPETQQRLRGLQQQIAQAADAETLQKTLVAYGQWLTRRTPGEQAELRSLPTDQRLRRVKEFIRQDNRRAARQLSPEEARALRDAVLSLVEQRKKRLLEQMRQEGAENPERRWERRREVGAWVIIRRELQDDQTRDEVLDRLTSGLSPTSRQHLESLPPRERWRQLQHWIREALQLELGPEQLERFFVSDELDNNEREHLLNLPPDEMEEELAQLYFGGQLGLRGMDWPRRFDPDRFGRDRRGPRQPPWGPEGRPRDPDRRGPSPDGFGPRRFDRGPGAPDDHWEDRGPPDHRPPPDAPPPEDGPPL